MKMNLILSGLRDSNSRPSGWQPSIPCRFRVTYEPKNAPLTLQMYPTYPKRETRVSDQQAKTRVHQTRTRGLGVRVDLVWRCLRDPKTTECCVPVSAADRRRCPGY